MYASLPIALSLLAACTDEGGDTAVDPEMCFELKSIPMNNYAEGDIELPRECQEALTSRWVDGQISESLWTWDWHLQDEDAKTSDSQVPIAIAGSELMDELVVQVGDQFQARHAMSILASGMLAATIDNDGYAGVAHPDGTSSLAWGCEMMARYADCSLLEPNALPCNPTGPPPPPKGTDPEGFCATTLNNFPSTPFVCTSTPLSTMMTQVVVSESGSSSTQWLTITPSAGAPPSSVWWPIFLAAYVGEAPALLLVRTTSGKQAILAIHQIGIQVTGPASEVSKVGPYIEAQMVTGDMSVPAPDWPRLRIVMPGSLQYRPYPATGGVITIPALQTWSFGQNLVLPDGSQTSWAFSRAVGIVDPCRPHNEASGVSEAECRIRAEGWLHIVNGLMAATTAEGSDGTQLDTFSLAPSQSCP